MSTLDLEIDGMSCNHCVSAVSEALGDLDGVTVEHVEIGTARVAYEPERVSPAQIVEAIEDAGYNAQAKS